MSVSQNSLVVSSSNFIHMHTLICTAFQMKVCLVTFELGLCDYPAMPSVMVSHDNVSV